ncbi:MAG: flagellar motor protein MotB [Bdellovibrionales bacterium]
MAEPAKKLNLEDVKKLKLAEESLAATSIRHKREQLHVHTTSEEESSWLISYADMMTLLVGFFVMLQSFSKIDNTKFEQIKKATTKVFGGEYQVPFEKFSKSMKAVVGASGAGDQVVFHETDAGVDVTFRGALFFDSGSTELRQQAKDLLNSLVPIITEQAQDFGIVVEGHTDNNPVLKGGIYQSNWELSSVRACTVVRIFEEMGFERTRLKALGWGDTRPILPNADDSGKINPENQSQNRRVVIKILKDFDK